MPPSYFPLRWESTGDQWWYASPIDWAAANGHYDLVRELLRIDSNHLMTLTSLRRIRRLETVWDDEAQLRHVAVCRSKVAQKLFRACERSGKNSLLRAGYGGWLMYTAASAGDLSLIRELLHRNPLIVFGEGEYGVTDIFYAAARSNSSDVFWLLYDYAVSPRLSSGSEDDVPEAYRWEMKNRAVHAAARGGNVKVLKELLSQNGSDEEVLSFRDQTGSTILHSAAGKGQVQVMKELMASYDITDSVDEHGNTALHIAAYRGQALAVDTLIDSSPRLITIRNNSGDTFLHSAVSGFRTPAFDRIDRHKNLLKHLLSIRNRFYIEEIINLKNKDGRTVLHVAAAQNVDSGVVELLMSSNAVDLNVPDGLGMTPLDLLKQRPQSESSEFLIRRLLTAGGIFGCRDGDARRAIASQLKNSGNMASPGRSFRINDSEIFLLTDNAILASNGKTIKQIKRDFIDENRTVPIVLDSKTRRSAAQKLKNAFHWPRTKDSTIRSIKVRRSIENETTPIPLRTRFAGSHKRTLSVGNNSPIPFAKKKKLTRGLVHGVVSLQGFNISRRSRCSSLSRSSLNSRCSSTGSVDSKQKGVVTDQESDVVQPSSSKFSPFDGYAANRRVNENQSSPKRRARSRSNYFCFGSSGVSARSPVIRQSVRMGVNPPIESYA